MPYALCSSILTATSTFRELASDLDGVTARMRAAGVSHALCVSVNLETLPEVLAIAERFPNVYASVGVHPDQHDGIEPSAEQLVDLARHPKVVAIGETGLDYYRESGDLEWQRERFRIHIRAARAASKPLIIHTRQAPEDTIAIMADEGAAAVGGVMHCFTETLAVAEQAMALNFHISFSGIVTFKNARDLQARRAQSADRTDADRNRFSVSGADTIPGKDERACIRAARGRGNRRDQRAAVRCGRRNYLCQFLLFI